MAPHDNAVTDDEEIIVEDEETETGLVLVTADKLAEVISGMTEIDSTASVVETKHRIVAEMLAAETEEDLWRELPTWSSKDSVGKSFEIRDVRGVFASRFEDADTGTKGGFIACSAVDLETGEAGIFTTSALRLAGRIGWYYMHGKLPIKLTVIERGQSSGGYPILDAEKI